MTTVLDLVKLSLKDAGVLGVGQTPLAEDSNDAFTRLNFMVSEWNRKRWFVWHLLDKSVVCTGAQSYTIGPSQNIDVAVRPDKIESAFARQLVDASPNQIDYPLELVQARETYNQISLKQLQSFPMFLFYDSAWPTGVLYPWPIPQANIYELHVSIKETISQFTSLSQVINIPPEYYGALEYNLAIRICAGYTVPASPEVIGLAKDSLNTLRKANTQIARLKMPGDLIRPGVYNPYSDQIR